MRMSCNGCRVLRKGCSDDCILRPCLQWIASSDSQANATLFLAKFYGRAGLLNLIEAGPQHLRPSVFRSLLYEACGRIVNPVYGSVGMLWSGNWAQCQAAVDAVLRGSPIMHVPSPTSGESSAHLIISPPTACDIRHVRRDPNSPPEVVAEVMNRTGFKRSGAITSYNTLVHLGETWPSDQLQNGDSGKDDESLFSVETVEGSLVKEPNPVWELKAPGHGDDVVEVALDLTLGLV